MGTWGVQPLENDDGLEVKEIWDDFISGNLSAWESEKIYSFFKRVYFRSHIKADSEFASLALVAMAYLFLENKLAFPDEFKEVLGAAATYQLSAPVLGEWDSDKGKREKVLHKLAKDAGLDLKNKQEIDDEESPLHQEKKSLIRWFENLETINGVRQSMKLSTIDFIDEIKPDIGKALDSLYKVEQGADEDLEVEVSELRYAYMIWWVGFNLGYDSHKIHQMMLDGGCSIGTATS